ncbi:LEM domain-containing protein 2 [Callorhinchus milii]|uniref:LEM domain-containing protein 2 n=1 Tax=Callorhinchus milii TaxID=7868 RepID=UPI001C3F5994|nr:LEM domain-containing protein 2 [Callorhinchus milii]
MASAASDEKLRRELKRLGFSPGPITDSTRSLYARRLEQLRTEERLERVRERGSSLAARKRLSAPGFLGAPARQAQGEPRGTSSYTGTGLRLLEDDRWGGGEAEGPSAERRDAGTPGGLFAGGSSLGPWADTGRTRSYGDGCADRYWGPLGQEYASAPSTLTAGDRYTRPSVDDDDDDDYKSKYGPFAGDRLTGKAGGPFAGLSSAPPGLGRLSGDEPDGVRQTPKGKSRRDRLELHLSRFLCIATCLLALVLLGLVCVKTLGLAEGDQEDGRRKIKMLPMDCNNKTDAFCQSEENKVLMALLSQMYDYLAERAGEIECGDHSPMKHKCMLVADVKRHLTIINSNAHKFDVALQWIIQSKLDIGIRLVGEHSETVTSLDLVTCLESTHPQMTFLCRLKFALFAILNKMLIFLLVLGVLWILLLFLKYSSKKVKEQQDAVYEMVNKIIGVIHAHNRDWERNLELMPYIPIPHVRDTLIPPEDRSHMKKVWQKAVKFLESNESRIRTEGQRINGEDFLVWRWTQPSAYCDSIT